MVAGADRAHGAHAARKQPRVGYAAGDSSSAPVGNLAEALGGVSTAKLVYELLRRQRSNQHG